MIDPPVLDPRDEEQLVASVIDNLPAEITDRNRSAPEVALVEALGALYAAGVYALNAWPDALRVRVLNLLGYTPDPATAATVTLTFTASLAGAVVPAGTVVRSGAGASALRFTTDAELTLGSGASGNVAATCTTTGATGNVAALTLTSIETPVAGVVSVTNAAAATGGAEAEAVASLEARVPELLRTGGGRVVTDEDAEQVALAVAGVARVLVLGERGALTAHLLLTDLNAAYYADHTNAPDAATRGAVEVAITDATVPGVAVVAAQPTLKLLHLARVEVQLATGYTASTVRAAILAAFELELSPVAVFDTDGSTQLAPGWEWGATLYLNALVALFAQVPGVRRVGRVYLRESTDYGATWSAEFELATVAAWANGAPNSTLGLLGASRDLANPFVLVEL